MEIQLQELIDQIKNDGVKVAETEADTILSSAKEEAEKIIANAKAEADLIIAHAKSDSEKMVKSGEDSIRQAGRNLLISFRESVSRELKAIVSEKVDEVFSASTFEQIIISVVESWAKNPETENIALLLNGDDLSALENNLLSALKEKMLNGVTLKANDNFDGGFRIILNDDGIYYDYSSEAVVDMLSNYLSPKVTQLLKEAQ